MNNTVNVSIAGVAFILENEGYRLLKDYLVRIEVGYKGNPDGPEILSDIEARISELILGEQGADSVVAAARIRDIIGQLGLPDGIGSGTEADSSDGFGEERAGTLPRRLYRNPDGAKLGGVCNGLATYFRVDPTLVRLLFCAPLLLLIVISVIPFVNLLCGFLGTLVGVSFLLYLILWFAVPQARTPRQRLEMAGERITASSISRNVAADLNAASPSPRNERAASVFSELLYVVGRVLLFIIKGVLLIIGGALALGVIGMIVGLIALLSGGHIAGLPFYIAGSGALVAVMAVLMVMLPVILIIYLLLKLVFNLPSRRTTMSVLFGIWILVLIYLGVFCAKNYERIRDAVRNERIDWIFTSMDYHYDLVRSIDDSVTYRKSVSVNDSTRIERISVGDSTVVDTIRVERFTE